MESIDNTLNSQQYLPPLQPQLQPLKPNVSLGEGNQTHDLIGSFGDVIKGEMDKINQLQQAADQATETYALGGEIDLHNVILATEKADMALSLAVQVRNKLIEGYQEISRMHV